MNTLELKNNTLTSLEVAEMVEKEHHKLLRDIRTYVEQLDQSKIGYVDFFLESTYVDKKGEERPCFLITRKGCEFIANKLTGVKGTKFTAGYINKFHQMEQEIYKPKSSLEILELQLKAIKEVDEKVDEVANDFATFKLEMPVLALDIDKITKAKNKIAVAILGGKESEAYKDANLRSTLYRDIERELRRQFNIHTHKELKRCEVDKAVELIKAYKPPLYLKEEIEIKNNQLALFSSVVDAGISRG
nr:ORF6C domain-containing protein [uncultured Tyzzerella sp.]